ncbi:hypothetical protein [Planomonospora parontospora]|nr:hypothetical protein [Planomonospora parontospora]
MIFRSTVAYGSFAVMAAILIVTAVIARRRRHNGIVITQLAVLRPWPRPPSCGSPTSRCTDRSGEVLPRIRTATLRGTQSSRRV